MPFNVGPGEIILVLAIALLVLGPGRLPEVGASLGKTIREFRKASSEVEEAANLEPARTPGPVAPAPPAAPPASVAPASSPEALDESRPEVSTVPPAREA